MSVESLSSGSTQTQKPRVESHPEKEHGKDIQDRDSDRTHDWGQTHSEGSSHRDISRETETTTPVEGKSDRCCEHQGTDSCTHGTQDRNDNRSEELKGGLPKRQSDFTADEGLQRQIVGSEVVSEQKDIPFQKNEDIQEKMKSSSGKDTSHSTTDTSEPTSGEKNTTSFSYSTSDLQREKSSGVEMDDSRKTGWSGEMKDNPHTQAWAGGESKNTPYRDDWTGKTTDIPQNQGLSGGTVGTSHGEGWSGESKDTSHGEGWSGESKDTSHGEGLSGESKDTSHNEGLSGNIPETKHKSHSHDNPHHKDTKTNNPSKDDTGFGKEQRQTLTRGGSELSRKTNPQRGDERSKEILDSQDEVKHMFGEQRKASPMKQKERQERGQEINLSKLESNP